MDEVTKKLEELDAKFPGEMWFDKQGRPLTDYTKIEKLLGDYKYKRVAETYLPRYWVSTVWLGLNHGLYPGKPIIFETMVFKINSTQEKGDSVGEYTRRYATLAQAKAGHKQVVAEVRGGGSGAR